MYFGEQIVRPAVLVACFFLTTVTTAQVATPEDSYAQQFSNTVQMHIAGSSDEWLEKAAIFSDTPNDISSLAGVAPLMLETWFNDASQRFLIENDLLAGLQKHRFKETPSQNQYLPNDAKVLLLSWWPVSAEGATPIPVWQAKNSGAVERSNGYLHWPTAALVQTLEQTKTETLTDISQVAVAGKFRPISHRASLNSLFHILVTESVAAHWNEQKAGNKLSRMVLGRPLRAGDFLALVAAHGVWGDSGNGHWLTLWWQPDKPAELMPLGPSDIEQHYAFDSCSDSTLPREPDGSPNSCFNPWLEGGLVSHSGITPRQSNCISCHARASFPPQDFLNVTQGEQHIPPNSLPTGMLWSPALRARDMTTHHDEAIFR